MAAPTGAAAPVSAASAVSTAPGSASAAAAPGAPAAPLLRAALFDIDGTLSDTDVYHRDIFRELLAKEGIDCNEQFFEQHVSGRANALIVEDLLPHYSAEQKEEWVQMKEQLFRDRAAAGLEPLTGLMELLQSFRARGVRVAAVTNAPKLNAHMILRALNLHPEGPMPFDLIVLGEECSRPKPHPDPYLKAMELLGVRPEQCCVFEDSLPGAKAGRDSGAVTIGVRTSQTDEALRKAGAHVTIHDFAQLDHDRLINDLADFVRADATTPAAAAHP